MGYYDSAAFKTDCNQEILTEALGAENLLDALAKYFSLDDWADALESIAADWDVEIN